MRRVLLVAGLAVLAAGCGKDLSAGGPEVRGPDQLRAVLSAGGYRCDEPDLTPGTCEIPAIGSVAIFESDEQQDRWLDFYENCGDGEHEPGPTALVVGHGWVVTTRGPGVAHDMADRTGAEAHTVCDGGFATSVRNWFRGGPHLILIAFWLAVIVGTVLLGRDQVRRRRQVDVGVSRT